MWNVSDSLIIFLSLLEYVQGERLTWRKKMRKVVYFAGLFLEAI